MVNFRVVLSQLLDFCHEYIGKNSNEFLLPPNKKIFVRRTKSIMLLFEFGFIYKRGIHENLGPYSFINLVLLVISLFQID